MRSSDTHISVKGKTAGSKSTEGRLTIGAIACGVVAIVGQVAGKLFFDIDLGVNIDTTLTKVTGGGAIYAVARTVLKSAIAIAEGKAKAAKLGKPDTTQPQPETVAARPVEKPQSLMGGHIPPPRNQPPAWPDGDMENFTAPVSLGHLPQS